MQNTKITLWISTLSIILLLSGCENAETTRPQTKNPTTLEQSDETLNNEEEVSVEQIDEIPEEISEDNNNEAIIPKATQAGWYMRTKVIATTADGTVYAHKSAGVFGELKESQKEKDRHDIVSYGPAVLQVVFPQYSWEEGEAGDYWSNYHHYAKNNTETRAVWTFQIKNQKTVNLSNTDIEIQLDDAIKVYYSQKKGSTLYEEIETDNAMKENFTLVDVDTNRTYQTDELENANLNMDGKHTRTFKWVRGRVEEVDFSAVVLP